MTARKALVDAGGRIVRVLSVSETSERCGGLYRLGLDASELVAWRELPALALMPDRVAAALRRVAYKQGASPREWYGSLEPVPIEKCIVQFLRGDRWTAPAAPAAAGLSSA